MQFSMQLSMVRSSATTARIITPRVCLSVHISVLRTLVCPGLGFYRGCESTLMSGFALFIVRFSQVEVQHALRWTSFCRNGLRLLFILSHPKTTVSTTTTHLTTPPSPKNNQHQHPPQHHSFYLISVNTT